MLNKLTITFLAGALTLVSLPALAFDIPETGSKNFSPSGNTPSYFANESAPISARTADTTASDFTAEEAEAPTPSGIAASPSGHRSAGRHGRYASAQKFRKHTPGKSSFHNSATQTRTVRTTTAKHGKAGARHARAA
jgi:hypothetical protein